MVECSFGVAAVGAERANQRVAGIDTGMPGSIFFADIENQVARNCLFGGDFSESPSGRIGHEAVAVACAMMWIVERGCGVDAGHGLPRAVGEVFTAASI